MKQCCVFFILYTGRDQHYRNSWIWEFFLMKQITNGDAVLRIRDDYPDLGSDFFPSWIRISPSLIRIKEFKFFNPKKWFLSSSKYYPGCSSRIRILTFFPSRIQGQNGTGSRIRIRKTVVTEAPPRHSTMQQWSCVEGEMSKAHKGELQAHQIS